MDNRLKEVLERYESGNATIKELKLIEDWFASFDKEQLAIESELNEELFESIDQHIQYMLHAKKTTYRSLSRWLSAAAALFIAGGLYFFKHHQANEPAIQPTFTLITAPKGLKKEVSLPDGTIVYLNSASAIRIPSNFNSKTREITLSGEAFFLVKHNAAKPFAIHSGKLLITDLGTGFNVKAYPDERQISVAVESGKVKVEKSNAKGNKEIFANAITHNQQLVYDTLSNVHHLHPVQINNVIAWHQNQLRFENASVDEIAQVLQRWYNVSIQMEHNNGHYRRYTVSFNNEPISKVLKVFANLSGISYQIDQQNIIINLQNCKKI